MASLNFISTDSQVAQAATGVNASKAMSFNFPPPSYILAEPQEGIIGTLFPSDNTWHSLYEHDYKEIASHLFSIQGAVGADEQKLMMVNRVKDIVIESYHHGAMAHLYWCVIIVAILCFIKFYYGVESSMLTYLIIGTAVVGGCYWIYAATAARGQGLAYWNTFMADLTSKLSSGTLPSKILVDYGADAEREKDRLAMATATRSTQNSGGGSSFLGAALGAIAGMALR